MELVTENLLYREGGLKGCPIGGVPKAIAIGGEWRDGEAVTWATLMTGFVWREREHFLFMFDGGLRVEDELWIKYGDEWRGLVEVKARVVSVVARSGSFEIQAAAMTAEVVRVLAA